MSDSDVTGDGGFTGASGEGGYTGYDPGPNMDYSSEERYRAAQAGDAVRTERIDRPLEDDPYGNAIAGGLAGGAVAGATEGGASIAWGAARRAATGVGKEALESTFNTGDPNTDWSGPDASVPDATAQSSSSPDAGTGPDAETDQPDGGVCE